MGVPFFSIVVPVYKAEDYLEDCLETLVTQSVENYEVILVDDGSPDNCGVICDVWQQRYPNVLRVIHQENRGQIMARNAGIQAARGAYLVFVDSDDILRSDALEIIDGYIRQYDADMVIYHFSADPGFAGQVRQLPIKDGEVMDLESSAELRSLLFGSFSLNSLCRKAIRRSLVQENWEFSSVAHIRNGEDLIFSIPVMEAAKRIVFADQILYYYRENPQSVTKTPNPGLFRSMREVLRIQRQHAERWDPTGELVRKCDAHGLFIFYDDVMVQIIRSALPWKEKRIRLTEVVKDEDFLRNYAFLGQIASAKARLSLFLARHRCFLPLLLYGSVRNCF